MGQWFRIGYDTAEVQPQNAAQGFSVSEIQHYVGGYAVIYLVFDNGDILLVNEDAGMAAPRTEDDEAPKTNVNFAAWSYAMQQKRSRNLVPILGNALLCHKDELH